jgi:hypothetical protein
MSGPYFTDYDIPKDWKMPKNALSKEFGDIPIGRVIEPPFVHHGKHTLFEVKMVSLFFLP